MISKRRDDKGRVLQQGEWQEPSGRYRYKYTDSLGKLNRSLIQESPIMFP